MALVHPKTPFVSTGGVVLTRADIVDDTNPHVKAHPHLFEPIRATIGGDLEQATARPGEKSNARRQPS